jgi:hypothetical protein
MIQLRPTRLVGNLLRLALNKSPKRTIKTTAEYTKDHDKFETMS